MQDNQELIEKVKKETCIFELADQFGARPSANGSCKHNPLRSERTCSLKLYRATNTYSDFGDEAGDVISFYMKATGCDFKKAIEDLSGENLEKPKKLEPIKNNNTYMLPEAIERAFNSIFHKNINFKNEQQLEKLKTIAPLWVYSEADKADLTFFKSITKWVQNLTTTIHKMPDRNDISHTMKYRYYFDEEKNKMIKWRTVTGTKSSYLYCRLTNRDTILIVEGARDFLTASLLGFDVVSLYSKNYKFTEDDYKLLENKKCIFMDDKGETVIKDIYDKFSGEKIYFNHSAMNEITKCESKDLSDYLYHFESMKDFKEAFDEVTKSNGTWLDALKSSKSLLTIQALNDAPEVETLIDGFLFKGTATVLHSKAGQGKSSLLLAVLNKMISENTIDNFIYFDADNPMSVLKHRIGKLAETFGDRMIYHTHTLSSTEALKIEMERLCMFKSQGKNTFIVIDTLGKFVKSVNNDEEVKPFIDLVCRLRDEFGATVCLVHHSNKTKDDDDNVVFRGSSVIHGDTDFMWGLERKQNKVVLKNNKGRFEYFEKIEANVDIEKYLVDLKGSYEYETFDESQDEVSEAPELTIEIVKQFIGDKKIGLKEIKSNFSNYDKELLKNMLYENLNIHWTKEAGKTVYNPIYSVINTAPKIIEYESDLPDVLL